ncbi:MAG: CDP-alcohol phosphatidyltransferase [Fusobacteria bacterium]|nr:MAG: CDP-alcohol phosphatidyltransferase [Fusobacteriota bacterium]KAF0228566.1 MAG: CDP-alcohol [Fusobacteriota bacterium]
MKYYIMQWRQQMELNYSCPITGDNRDNTTIRIVAGLVFTITGATIAIGLLASYSVAAIIFGLLGVDFIIRAFLLPKYSLLARFGKGIAAVLNLKKLMVDSGPKIFAARIGVIFTLSGTSLYALGYTTPASIVAGILLLCAGLEAFFNFCLGCWMYALLPRSIGKLFTYQFIK